MRKTIPSFLKRQAANNPRGNIMEIVKVVVTKDGKVVRVLLCTRITALELSLDYERRYIEVEVTVEKL